LWFSIGKISPNSTCITNPDVPDSTAKFKVTDIVPKNTRAKVPISSASKACDVDAMNLPLNGAFYVLVRRSSININGLG